MSKANFGGIVILLIVAMRLAGGYHFFSEGLQKLSPGFTSEHFLRGAKGPLAEKLHALAPGPHKVYELLAQPREWGSLEEQQAEADQAWAAPYRDWATEIDQDWKSQRNQTSNALDLSDDQQQQAEQAYVEARTALEDYLMSVEAEIEEYQQQLWHIEGLKAQIKDQGGSLPYVDERIATQTAETAAALKPWIAEVAAIEQQFHSSLLELADPEQRDSVAFQDALEPPTELDRVNTVVTWVVLGSGVLLFIGLFTRVAAVVAAGFLVSVIATQPPWVFGADTTYLFYQVFEVAGLLLLAAVGAGRWLGFDAVLSYLLGARTDKAEANN